MRSWWNSKSEMILAFATWLLQKSPDLHVVCLTLLVLKQKRRNDIQIQMDQGISRRGEDNLLPLDTMCIFQYR